MNHPAASKCRGLALTCLLLSVLSGCFLERAEQQAAEVEGAGTIKGTVKVTSDQKGSVIVLRYREVNGIFVQEERLMASSKGTYRFDVRPGDHFVAAFIDTNRDGLYQPGEHGFYHLDPLTVTVQSGEIVTVDPMTISGDPPEPPEDRVVVHEDTLKSHISNIGKVVPLADPKFDRKHYSMGMWRPVDFVEQVGAGLFMLQDFEEDKLPVVFVHGISGGPHDWESAIQAIDREQFQPWVLYYPSGIPLDIVARYFVQAIELMKNQYGFDRFAVAAHSMGGLVTRSFVKKFVELYPEQTDSLRFVLTVNSPIGGLKSAQKGVNLSPVVVPSWRDITPDSEFVQGLLEWSWPAEVPYHLVFSYKDGSSGDGTVSLNSQIPWSLQAEAVRTYGFNDDHVGTLDDETFLALFARILDDSVEVD